jgi:thymidine phosphorylase
MRSLRPNRVPWAAVAGLLVPAISSVPLGQARGVVRLLEPQRPVSVMGETSQVLQQVAQLLTPRPCGAT